MAISRPPSWMGSSAAAVTGQRWVSQMGAAVHFRNNSFWMSELRDKNVYNLQFVIGHANGNDNFGGFNYRNGWAKPFQQINLNPFKSGYLGNTQIDNPQILAVWAIRFAHSYQRGRNRFVVYTNNWNPPSIHLDMWMDNGQTYSVTLPHWGAGVHNQNGCYGYSVEGGPFDWFNNHVGHSVGMIIT